jgi:glycosyltransferase involved in cell wall biosynthesis
MKIHWFSPLPPQQSDIANYTVRLMPHLAALCDLTVWTTAHDVPRAVKAIADVRQIDCLDWAVVNRGDACFYQIGNNPDFHGRIWEIARRHPGVMVLHDARVHHLVCGSCRREEGGDDRYLSAMIRHYGDEGLEVARAVLSGEREINDVVDKYPLAEAVLESALAAVTHTDEAARAARRRCPTLELPLPYPCPAKCERVPREEPVDARHPARLVVFGYIASNRRLDAVLEALAGLDVAERASLRLDVYGELWDEKYVRGRIAALALQEHVALHGFVGEDVLDAALRAADLALNLRNPTMGEASGSQLRLWAAGLPSLVTRTGWYASLPEDAVRFVDPHREQADIQRHLRDLIARPDSFAALGRAGFEHLRTRHAPAEYARRLLDFTARLELAPAKLLRTAMARRVVELGLPWICNGIERDVADAPARAIAELLPRS